MRANFHVFPNQFFVTVSGAEVLQCKIPTRNQTTGKKNLKDYVSDCLKKEKKLFKKKEENKSPHHMGSHAPSSKDGSPFLEGGSC